MLNKMEVLNMYVTTAATYGYVHMYILYK